jgi:hypothetical protein
MKRDERDVLKQMAGYADGIAAFSALQSIAFALNVGGSGALASNVHDSPYLAATGIVLSFFVYSYLIVRCHRNEDRLAGQPDSSPLGQTVKEIRRMRIIVVLVASILCLALTAVAAKSSKKAIAARNRPPVELQVPERDQPRNAE